ncbi:hypothetical protein AAMO2058_000851200 [Amorphochlora amoebiformis]
MPGLHEAAAKRGTPNYEAIEVEKIPENFKSTAWQTAIVLAKTISGTGNFALPFAFLNMGLIGGSVTVMGAALLTAWTLTLMQEVKNSRYIEERGLPNETYVDIAYAGFGSKGAAFMYFVTLFCLEGVCSVYLNFVSTTAHSIYPHIDQNWYLLITLSFAVLMTMVNNMNFLKYMSGLGIISVTFTILCVMYFSVDNYELKPLDSYPMFRFDTYFRTFGSIAFFFCVNVNAMPIEREMRDRSKWGTVALSTCVILAVINIIYGGMVFLLLDNDTCGNVVMNLRPTPNTPAWVVDLPKITMIVELVVSYPLILYAAVDIVQRSLGKSCTGASSHMVTFVMATLPAVFAQIKSFAILVNLVGGFGAAISAYCFPPLLFIKVCGNEFETSRAKVLACAGVGLIGFAMSIATTAFAINAMWNPYPEPDFCRG